MYGVNDVCMGYMMYVWGTFMGYIYGVSHNGNKFPTGSIYMYLPLILNSP